MRILILGVPYECEYKTSIQDRSFSACDCDCDGYCDFSTHRIIVRDYTKDEREELGRMADLDAYKRKCFRHELVHAFLYESGLTVNSVGVDAWASCEEIVDWIAIQGPKIYAVWQQAGCLEVVHNGGAQFTG